jgi:hypothetical protein
MISKSGIERGVETPAALTRTARIIARKLSSEREGPNAVAVGPEINSTYSLLKVELSLDILWAVARAQFGHKSARTAAEIGPMTGS